MATDRVEREGGAKTSLILHDIQKIFNGIPKTVLALILSHFPIELTWLCKNLRRWDDFIWGKGGLSGTNVFLDTDNCDVIRYALYRMSKEYKIIPFANIQLPPRMIILLNKHIRDYISRSMSHQLESADNSLKTIENLISMYTGTCKKDKYKGDKRNEKFDKNQVNPICIVMYSLLNDDCTKLCDKFKIIAKVVPILKWNYLFNINETIQYLEERWGIENPIVREIVGVLRE
jgi:hypothetical protein